MLLPRPSHACMVALVDWRHRTRSIKVGGGWAVRCAVPNMEPWRIGGGDTSNTRPPCCCCCYCTIRCCFHPFQISLPDHSGTETSVSYRKLQMILPAFQRTNGILVRNDHGCQSEQQFRQGSEFSWISSVDAMRIHGFGRSLAGFSHQL